MGKLIGWIDDRFPLMKMWNEHLAEYYAPKNFNFWYFFGSLALLVLVIQAMAKKLVLRWLFWMQSLLEFFAFMS